MALTVLNTAASISGKTLLTAEGAYTQTGLITFDRDPSAPFAVTSSSAVVTNLDADKLDGSHLSALPTLAGTNQFTGYNNITVAAGGSFFSLTSTGAGATTWHQYINTSSEFILFNSITDHLRLNTSGFLRVSGGFQAVASSAAIANAADQTVTGTYKSVIRLTGGGASCTLGGISGGSDGQFLVIMNCTGTLMPVLEESAGQTAANRIAASSDYGARSIPEGGFQFFVYDNTTARWRQQSFL